MNPKCVRILASVSFICVLTFFGEYASIANAQGELGAFGARPSYNNVPDLANPGSFAPHIVFYSLPNPATSSSIYAGPCGAFFDVFARVSGDGTLRATGFGLFAVLDGNGEVIFDPAPIAGGANPPNNIPYSLNPDFPQNNTLDIMYGVTNVQGGGNRSLAVTALNDLPATNVTITHGDGLAAIRVTVAGGVQGLFHVEFLIDPTYTSFINAAGQLLTNPPLFPHATGLIEVRPSVRGDMNGDGVVNPQDVGLFIGAISDPGAFKQQYPWLQTDYIADFNEDRLINIDDLPGFQRVVIPEPATAALAVFACLSSAFLTWRRGRPRQESS